MRTDYDRFRVDPHTPTIGAEVHGVALDQVDDETCSLLRQAWLDWKVLFFHQQPISVEAHIEFGRRFGELEVHPFVDDDGRHPELVVIDSTPDKPRASPRWHTDTTWRERPAMGSILRMSIPPEMGGDTMWADMEQAYNELDDALKARIEGRFALHSFVFSFGPDLSPSELERMTEKYPPVRHPIVRTHPETGSRSLYVNRSFTTHIEDLDPQESTCLLEQLYETATKPERQVRFRWQADSFAWWDNRNTQHRVVVDFQSSRRRIERVTIAGDRPA